jgi:hypothetical protein
MPCKCVLPHSLNSATVSHSLSFLRVCNPTVLTGGAGEETKIQRGGIRTKPHTRARDRILGSQSRTVHRRILSDLVWLSAECDTLSAKRMQSLASSSSLLPASSEVDGACWREWMYEVLYVCALAERHACLQTHWCCWARGGGRPPHQRLLGREGPEKPPLGKKGMSHSMKRGEAL